MSSRYSPAANSWSPAVKLNGTSTRMFEVWALAELARKRAAPRRPARCCWKRSSSFFLIPFGDFAYSDQYGICSKREASQCDERTIGEEWRTLARPPG